MPTLPDDAELSALQAAYEAAAAEEKSAMDAFIQAAGRTSSPAAKAVTVQAEKHLHAVIKRKRDIYDKLIGLGPPVV